MDKAFILASLLKCKVDDLYELKYDAKESKKLLKVILRLEVRKCKTK